MLDDETTSMGGMDASQPGDLPEMPAPPVQQEGPNSPVPPEVQSEYNRFVGRAMQLIYSDQVLPMIVQMLEKGGDQRANQARALATTTVAIITRVTQAAQRSNVKLSADLIFYGGTEIFGLIAEISDTIGLTNYAKDRRALEAAYFQAIEMYIAAARKRGDIDPEMAKEQMQRIQQLDASGKLQPLLLALDKRDSAARQASASPAPDGEEMPPDEEEAMEGEEGPDSPDEEVAEAPEEEIPEDEEPPPEDDNGLRGGMVPRKRRA